VYHPYYRGKQYELISIREMAAVFAAADFRPIVEPVRESLGGLRKALDAVLDADGHAVVIVNPHHGDMSGAGGPVSTLLKDQFGDPRISAGILLKPNMTVVEGLKYYKAHAGHSPVLIHAGFTDAKGLADKLGTADQQQRHVFLEPYCGKLYQKHFKGAHRILVRDGLKKKRNADYAPIEPFSDLHVTFEDEGMDGFGDFLIVGDEYTEGGGPAYAVAIHLTFIDPDQDDAMQIYHFLSDRQNTPTDPAGKFAEALGKMIKTIDGLGSKVLESEAVKEFRVLHADKHFPGLGYVKKLSMNHHIETLANYFETVP
jgi:hypothetical protein